MRVTMEERQREAKKVVEVVEDNFEAWFNSYIEETDESRVLKDNLRSAYFAGMIGSRKYR